MIFNLIFSVRIFRSEKVKSGVENPKISVLVAARNEELNLPDCLESLARLNYPKDKMEILIGDDGSEDDTAGIIKSFAEKNPQFRYVHISKRLGGIRGKQNVLAQLAQKASGTYFLITDADITHHPDWANRLISSFTENEKIGIVTGPTVVHSANLWSGFQAIDWLIGMVTVKALDTLNLPVTAVGNNMAVSAEAYCQTGGYENLPFSITEDYLLFEAVLKKGYTHKWLFDSVTANESAPVSGIKTLFHQRKRWFKGGMKGPWYAPMLFTFYSLAFPLLIFGFLWELELFYIVLFFLIKTAADLILVTSGAVRLKKISMLKYFPFYVPYSFFNTVFIGLYLLLPVTVNWKGRMYR